MGFRGGWLGWSSAAWAAWILWLPLGATAQEIEPRSYSASPVGTKFAVAVLGNTRGEIVFDASSALSDVTASINTAAIGVGGVFGLAGRQSSLALAVPYAWGGASGNVGEDRRSITRSGLADPRLRFSMILLGGPALSRAAFQGRKRGPMLGVSLVVVPPLGQYDPDKLVNIGTNRWAWKPEIGVSFPRGAWQFDVYAGAWLFDDNTEFYGGRRRSQEPLTSYQAHVSYTFRPGLWAAADATYYSGGVTTVGGLRSADLQNNLRYGLTLSMALKQGHSLKLGLSDGAMTRVGGDFVSVGLSWQYAWFD